MTSLTTFLIFLLFSVNTNNEEVTKYYPVLPYLSISPRAVKELHENSQTPACSIRDDIFEGINSIEKCFNFSSFFLRMNSRMNDQVKISNISEFSQNIMFNILNHCPFSGIEDQPPVSHPFWKHFFVNIGMITIINLLSGCGALLYKLYIKTKFRLFLLLCMSFSVGVLVTNGLVHFIPEGFGYNPAKSTSYVKISSLSLVGIIVFVTMEMMLRIFVMYRSRKLSKKVTLIVESSGNIDMDEDPKIVSASKKLEKKINILKSLPQHFYAPVWLDPRVPSYAMLITIGDAFHNLMDGVAIGASFASSLSQGYVTFLGVAAEELPQEIGDFAALLCAGLNPRQALFWNLISSLSSYLGSCIGFYFGDISGLHQYISAFCGGMFIYIALYAVLPEVINELFTLYEHNIPRLFLSAIIVILSISLGMGFMVGMAFLAKYI